MKRACSKSTLTSAILATFSFCSVEALNVEVELLLTRLLEPDLNKKERSGVKSLSLAQDNCLRVPQWHAMIEELDQKLLNLKCTKMES